MDEEMIANIRARIERCRRLASLTIDERARRILRDMADEDEADLRRLEAGRAAPKNDGA